MAAKIPGADAAAFEKAAQDAKAGCPISRLLKAEITMTAKLVGGRASTRVVFAARIMISVSVVGIWPAVLRWRRRDAGATNDLATSSLT